MHVDVLKPLLIIFAIYILDIKKKYIKWYQHVLLFVFLLLFSSLYSHEQDRSYYALTEKEVQEYITKRDTHYYDSYLSMTFANDEILKMFECDEKKLSQAIICGTASAIIYKNITAAGIAAAISLVKDYMQDFYMFAKKIERWMLESQYNWEMAVFYQNLLDKNENDST